MKQATMTTTAKELATAWRAEGFTLGLPAGLPASAARIDRGTCARLRCPCCRKRGMRFRPFRKPGHYRILAVCPCGGGEVL